MSRPLIIATRGSALALAQSEGVATQLRDAHPGLEVRLEVLRTRGDALLDRPVAAIGKGAFVKEIQRAVLDGRADIAVHSFKDLPVEETPGLEVVAVPARADARDALVAHGRRVLTYLPEGARVGTGSLRRGSQLRRRRSDLEVVPIRGNVDTRLAKVDGGEVDAVVLAAAGLQRLGKAERICETFSVKQMVPAAGQGALALEARMDDDHVRRLLSAVDDPWTACAVAAERACLGRLGGGCNTPIGVHAVTDGETMMLRGFVSDELGRHATKLRWQGPWRQAEELGRTLAELLLAAGADRVLEGVAPPPRGGSDALGSSHVGDDVGDGRDG